MNLAPFTYWVQERERIRERRANGTPGPWTADPILAKYRFCNVRRADDRVTRWLVDNVYAPHREDPNAWFLCCAARFVNWPPAVAALLRAGDLPPVGDGPDDFNDIGFCAILRDRAARGEKNWTGVYLIKSETGLLKETYVARTLAATWAVRRTVRDALRSNLLSEVHAALTALHGWGPFLAYQAIVDMTYPWGPLAGAADLYRWAAAGPGTLRGLNRLHERAPSAGLSQDQGRRELRDLYPRLVAESGVELEFSDVPNVCCEVDKYLRVKNGEGAPRALYRTQAGAY